ncbi:hypothetical protein FRC08_005019, partial [Ceratobasidium sp. 394]
MSIPPSSLSSRPSPPPASALTAPAPPAPDSPAQWSRRILLELQANFARAHFGTDDEFRAAYRRVRAYLITCIDGIDARIDEKAFEVPRPFPKSCPGPGSGHTTPRPAAPVAHKAVATDPPPPDPPIVEACNGWYYTVRYLLVSLSPRGIASGLYSLYKARMYSFSCILLYSAT